MKKIILSILLIIGGLTAAAQESYESFYVQCEDTCSHMHGIDISHYQGEVFWETIGENTKLTYVYIKATEGGDRIDEKYAENIFFARKYGLKVGSYHFFRPRTNLQVQLDNFMTQCRPQDQDLIPLLDVETRGGLSEEAFCDSLVKFIGMMEKAYGQKPMIYTGTNFYNRYLQGLIDGYPLMIAQYTEYEPRLADDRDITMWQYTGKGHINGINGHVDKSRFMAHHSMRELRFKHTTRKEKNYPTKVEEYPF